MKDLKVGLVKVLLAGVGVLGLSAANSTIGRAQATATVTVNPSGTTTSIGASFLSFSLDLDETPNIMGTDTTLNPIFERLVKNVTAYANGPLELRELSDEDYTTNTTNDLTTMTNFYNYMSSNTTYGVRYFVGVDFQNAFDTNGNDIGSANTANEAETLYTSLPSGSLLSYEVGNEPDLYTAAQRGSSWNYTTYQSQYETVVNAIEAKSTGVPMDAPVFSGFASTAWSGNLTTFINDEYNHLGLFDLHYYPGSHCNGATVAGDFLMGSYAVNATATASYPGNMAGYIATLASHSKYNTRIGEMNSVACGGQTGVSDTFQSALWFADTAMSYAEAGVSGINLFTSSSTNYYSPFVFSHTGTSPAYTYSISKINPIYYGMMTTALMLQSNAALLPFTLTTSNKITAHVTKDSTGAIRVLLINKEESDSGTVTLNLTGRGNASVWQLLVTGNNYLASDYTNYSGSGDEVTLGGQTFKGSTDGSIQGTLSLVNVVPVSGVYTITMPKSSAAVVKIP